MVNAHALTVADLDIPGVIDVLILLKCADVQCGVLRYVFCYLLRGLL